jgi:hypothetical protein
MEFLFFPPQRRLKLWGKFGTIGKKIRPSPIFAAVLFAFLAFGAVCCGGRFHSHPACCLPGHRGT